MQMRQYFASNDICLTLVDMSASMLSHHRGDKLKGISSILLCHDQQIAMVKLLIAELYDLRMTAIMFTKCNLRNSVAKQFANGPQKTMRSEFIGLRNIMLCENIHKLPLLLFCDNIRKLLCITNDNCIFGAGKRECTCRHICLGRFIHNHIVKFCILPKTTA